MFLIFAEFLMKMENLPSRDARKRPRKIRIGAYIFLSLTSLTCLDVAAPIVLDKIVEYHTKPVQERRRLFSGTPYLRVYDQGEIIKLNQPYSVQYIDMDGKGEIDIQVRGLGINKIIYR
jgi:hypothetical protein